MARTANSDLVLRASVDNQASPEFGRMGDDANILGGTLTELNSGAELLSKGFGLAREAVTAIVGTLAECTREAMEAERAERDLATALLIYGDAAGGALEHSKAFADGIQHATGTSGDAILSMRALLVGLGILPQNLDAATQAALGWARTTGRDMNSAARDVAKVLEGKTDVLGRMGVKVGSVTEGIDFMRRGYQLLLKDGATLEGQLKILNEEWGDLRETLGASVTGSDAAKNSVHALTEELKRMREEVGSDKFKSDMDERIGIMAQMGAMAVRVGSALKRFWSEAIDREIRDASDPTKSPSGLMIEAWKAEQKFLSEWKPSGQVQGGGGIQNIEVPRSQWSKDFEAALAEGWADFWGSSELADDLQKAGSKPFKFTPAPYEPAPVTPQGDTKIDEAAAAKRRASAAKHAAEVQRDADQALQTWAGFAAQVRAHEEGEIAETERLALRAKIESLKAQEVAARVSGERQAFARAEADRKEIVEEQRKMRIIEANERAHVQRLEMVAGTLAGGTASIMRHAFRGEFDQIAADFEALIERMMMMLLESALLGFFQKALGVGIGLALGGPAGAVGGALAGGALDIGGGANALGGLGTSMLALRADRTDYAGNGLGTSAQGLAATPRPAAAERPAGPLAVITNNYLVPPNSAQTQRNLRDGVLPALRELRRRGHKGF